MSKDECGWSIENELLKLSRENDIAAAVRKLELCRRGQEVKAIRGSASWTIGGSETYIYPFSIIFADASCEEFILKAVTPFSPSKSIEDVLVEWVSRRRLLEEAGVNTPTLFFAGEGLILEKLIPHSLKEVLDKARCDEGLILEVFRYAGVLHRLGFMPNAPFADLRTDGTHVFAIDFGEDLGPAGIVESDSTQLYEQALEWLRKCSVTTTPRQLEIYRTGFLLPGRQEDSTTCERVGAGNHI